MIEPRQVTTPGDHGREGTAARLIVALRRLLNRVRAELAYIDAHRIRRHFCYFPCDKPTVLKHTHTDAAMRAKEWRQ